MAVTSLKTANASLYLIEGLENVGKELVPARTEFGRTVARDVKAKSARDPLHQHWPRSRTRKVEPTHRG